MITSKFINPVRGLEKLPTKANIRKARKEMYNKFNKKKEKEYGRAK